MARQTRVVCSAEALLHNLKQVTLAAPHQKIMAMVKANAYGCGITNVIPVLEGRVDAFGVAFFEEAMAIRHLGSRTDCVLLEGVFSPDEYLLAAMSGFHCVIHQKHQLNWLLSTSLKVPIRVWVKVDTGMHRLGFAPNEVSDVLATLQACPWVAPELGLMTHFASADEIGNESNGIQLQQFKQLQLSDVHLIRSLANSAAILSLPQAHADVVRPGIMLYGVSPFNGRTGSELGLKPVMQFVSAISTIHHYPENSPVGYGGTWSSNKSSIIGIVPVGYADGYPRGIRPNTPTWVNHSIAPIVGRVSMDMMAIDLTDLPHSNVGDAVELWGQNVPIETIAQSAGTIAYELLTKITPRVRELSSDSRA